jgi:hypothetical protein
MNTQEDNSNFWSDENLASGQWFKFSKVGDKIKGVLVGKSTKKGTDGFPDQIVYELKLDDGSYCNVGISVNKKFVVDRMRHAKFGQEVGFKFDKEIPAKMKGMNPAKSILVYLGEIKEKMDTPDEEVSMETALEVDPFN